MFVKQAKEKTTIVNVVSDFITTPTVAIVTKGNIEKELQRIFDDYLVRYIEENNTVVISVVGV